MSSDVQIYDRALVVSGKDDMQSLLTDPERFLRKVGAMDGIDQFNGLQLEGGGELKSAEEVEQFLRGRDRAITAHIGVPYKDACKWIILA